MEGVSDEIYEAIKTVMTSVDPLLLLIGNSTIVTGAFRRAFYQEGHLYYRITISVSDSPNVKQGKTAISGLTSAKWVVKGRETWGEENPIYRAQVLGEFPDQEEETLISISDVEAVARGWAEGEEWEAGGGSDEVVLAVDVARFWLRPKCDPPQKWQPSH